MRAIRRARPGRLLELRAWQATVAPFTSGNPSAPVGTQVGYIQQSGQISQTISLASGIYTVSFSATQRGNFQTSSQTIGVLFDGTAVEWFTPSGTSYATFTTNNITATAGTHTLTFVGLNPSGGDNTAFIDQVTFGNVNSVQDGGFENPNVGLGTAALSNRTFQHALDF